MAAEPVAVRVTEAADGKTVTITPELSGQWTCVLVRAGPNAYQLHVVSVAADGKLVRYPPVTITIGGGPVPPEPVPPNPPDPPVPPIPVQGLMVLMIEESADRDKLPSGQREILLSTGPGSVREWLRANAAKDGAGNPMFRLVDKDARPQSKFWQDAYDLWQAQREKIGTPAWVISNGRVVTVQPLPKTPQEALKVLEGFKL